MLDFILVLVFSIVMLLFMAFPAMKIVEWFEAKGYTPPAWHAGLVIGVAIGLSLAIGLFLKFA